MPFKNEVVSDEDIDRYNLPFPKGEGRWWTRDAERDYYLWGGRVGNPAYDDMQEGRFRLYVNGTVYLIRITPGEGSTDLYESPFIINWESIAGIQPNTASKEELDRIIQVLKEALIIYGYEGQDDNWVENAKVLIGF
jgi:hypothetical protein